MIKPYYADDAVTLHHGDCLDVLPTLPDCSVDAVVTDPPYGLEFMGKEWDSFKTGRSEKYSKGGDLNLADIAAQSGKGGAGPVYVSRPAKRCAACGKQAWSGSPCKCPEPQWIMDNSPLHSFQQWCQLWAAECLRVLKPGGHLLAFGGTRTWHRLVCAIEDAGFEIRDSIAWLYGSGFPKSLSVHKASLTAVESRYAEARCDCLDSRNGLLVGQGAGREGGGPVRNTGAERQVSESPSAAPDVQVIQGAGDLALRELRNASGEEGSRHDALAEALLFPSVRIGRTEAARHGHAAVRPGLEEHSGEGATAGQGVRGVQDATGRYGAAYPSPEAVPLRGDEPPFELDQPVRLVPSHGGGNHDGHAGSDPDRRNPRGVGLDDQGGRRAAVARICSWCGLPDREWLRSLEGLGTAAKPAHEPIMVARKPLQGTVAANVLRWGTGALNIDAARIANDGENARANKGGYLGYMGGERPDMPYTGSAGRWPANVALDETQAAALDEMSGERPSGGSQHERVPTGGIYGGFTGAGRNSKREADDGGASRFFFVSIPVDSLGSRFTYTAKADSGERITHNGVAHPTVKPLDLMRWLVRLVTPPGGLILDPFAGSGTTVEAALLEGFRCVAIEREPDYLPLITQRINRRRDPVKYLTAAGEDMGLLDFSEPA